jgi:7SK snRNA methylphosphate capping enzyme
MTTSKEAIYGNYPYYYGYRHRNEASQQPWPCPHDPQCTRMQYPATRSSMDARLTVFKRQHFEGKRILDVGCNAGLVSIELGRDWCASSVVGVDLDAGLIAKAKTNLSRAFSTCNWTSDASSSMDAPTTDDVFAFEGDRIPLGKSLIHRRDTMVRLPCQSADDRMDMADSGMTQGHVDAHYFPISMPLIFGRLFWSSRPPLTLSHQFPYNVSFQVGNVMDESFSAKYTDGSAFDVIFLLSVTKWIHVHHGDDGLRRIFAMCFQMLSSGGEMVVEPQLWSSYTSCITVDDQGAIRSKFNPNVHLELRPDYDQGPLSFWHVLEQIGFVGGTMLFKPDAEAKGFLRRPIWSFRKP